MRPLLSPDRLSIGAAANVTLRGPVYAFAQAAMPLPARRPKTAPDIRPVPLA